MRIVENNYVPKTYEIDHVGYRHVCEKCNSVVDIEKDDLEYDSYYMRETCMCPCCHNHIIFKKDNSKKVKWVETIVK